MSTVWSMQFAPSSASRIGRRVAAAVLAGGLALSACGGSSAPVETSAESVATSADTAAETTAPAEAATVLAISGNQIEVAPAGQDTLLWFWAPW